MALNCSCRFLDAFHLSLSAHFVYYYIVVNYDNPSALLWLTWSYKVRQVIRKVATVYAEIPFHQLRSVVDVRVSGYFRRCCLFADPHVGTRCCYCAHVSGIISSHAAGPHNIWPSLYTLRLWTCSCFFFSLSGRCLAPVQTWRTTSSRSPRLFWGRVKSIARHRLLKF